MAKKTVSNPVPLTFDLPVSLLKKIEQHRKQLGLASTSEVVRHAIAEYDLSRFEASVDERRQISVRLDLKVKTALARTAKKQKASIGDVIRAAVESLPTKKGKR
ncbi:MAG: ribbon-helix-helix domain-containing protein [Opitutaceae bacterium]|jgi:Arc/MetJ-type ribon-helix-helix transcriptional regulator|nr:ribbon-helix-helix domain-containing protein [Opitutaceae bacterium]